MNNMRPTEEALRLLSKEITRSLDSPFLKGIEGNDLALRFDEILLRNTRGLTGALEVVFKWKGKELAFIQREDVRLTTSNTLAIAGIEGHQRVNITEGVRRFEVAP